MNNYLTILLITAATGVGGLALGGALATALHSPSDRTVSLLLRFTAGVILSLVCFDLVADALEQTGVLTVICYIMIGCLCTYLLNCWIDRQAHHSHSHGGGPQEHERHDHPHEHGHHHEPLVQDNGEMCACGHHTLHTAGLVLAAAVALHNMPVGMAIGAAFAGPAQSGGRAGVLAAIIIGLHNIPEGMSIAAPLITGGSRPAGAVGVAALSGLPTILGALLGAMLYVVFGELLPESEHLWQDRLSGVGTLLGMLLGMALIFLHR